MTSQHAIQLVTRDQAETQGLGERLGRWVRRGDVVLLHGDLGAGKTTLAQGIARGLAVQGAVQSPTFTLIHEYEGRSGDSQPVRLYHLDLYRLAGTDELDSFGFDDYLAPVDGVSLIEWPERATGHLPDRYLLVHLEHDGEGQRRLTIDWVQPGAADADRLNALRGTLLGPLPTAGAGGQSR